MRKLFNKMMAVTLSASMVLGMTGVITAAVKTGTDIVGTTKWTSYSIHTREDKGEWEDALIKDKQFYDTNVTEDSGKDAYKAYGENAKISEQTAAGFKMDVTSTGWSANYGPSGKKDEKGNLIYEVKQSNPWGVTADKVLTVERGRTYTISFKIKSTLKNEITETKERSDGTAYNVGTGKYNYTKHIHFKAFDNKDSSGAALKLKNMSAKIGGKSVITTSNKDFNPFVALDSQNTADDGWVAVQAEVTIPVEKKDYQAKSASPTMGFKFAFGAFLKEYPDENNMSGTIEVADFKVVAGDAAPAQVKLSKVKAKKKAIQIKFKKATGAKKYEVKYATKKSFKGAKTKTIGKTSITIKKLKAKTTYFVKVRGFYTKGSTKVYGAFSAVKSAKVK